MSQCLHTRNIHLFKKHLEDLPADGRLYYSIAELYQQDGRWQDALEFFKKALKYKSVHSPIFFLDFAKTYKSLNKVKKALKYYEKVSLTDLASYKTHLAELARFYIDQEEYEKSKQCYLLLVPQEPQNTWYLNNLAWDYIKLDDYETALTHLLEVEKIDPKDAWAIGKIGLCYQEQPNYTLALQYHLKARALGSPEEYWNESCIAWCKFVVGEIAEAEHIYNELFKKDRKDYQLMNMGHVLLVQNRKEEALQYYKESAKKYKNSQNFEKEFLDDFQYIEPHQVMTKAEYEKLCQKILKKIT